MNGFFTQIPFHSPDIHFEDSEDFSPLMYKIEFAKNVSNFEKTYIKYAGEISFFVQYIIPLLYRA